MQPFFSIITIVYNNVSIIDNTIKSVINQSYKNIQYIIVDGKSDDGTVRQIEKYITNIDIFISEEDSGIADAFNKGISKAIGKWVLFLNSGDTFYDNVVLQKVYDLIEKEPADKVFFGEAFVLSSRKNYIQNTNKNFLDNVNNPSNGICHQAAFVPSATIQACFFDRRLKMSMDFDFWLRLSSSNIKFVKLPIIICNYCSGGISSSSEKALEALCEHWAVRIINRSNNKIPYLLILESLILLKIKLVCRKMLGNKIYDGILERLK
jgi:glycosyltransferase involved in cell wall biosynthesis